MKRFFKLLSENAITPKRGTKHAAGYDLFIPLDHKEFVLNPGEKHLVETNVAVSMYPDESFEIIIRSSLGIKKSIVLSNQVGLIDSDYFDNPSNGGNIMIELKNIGKEAVSFKPGDKVAQGIFRKYLTVEDEDENELTERVGGIGSTGKK